VRLKGHPVERIIVGDLRTSGGLAGEGDVSRSAFEGDPDELAVTPAQATFADDAEAIEGQFEARR
jgi:hypothetical protein